MLGLLGMTPTVTPEMNRMMFENHGRSREDQPLDLSRKSGLEAIIDIETANYSHKQRKQNQPTLDATEKETTGQEEIVRNGYGIKRNYSQVDLTAAVNDIRCGRLGTRRASVVYGIPRSTLRNKIYKLEAAEEQAGQAPLNKRRRPGEPPLQLLNAPQYHLVVTERTTNMTADIMGTGGKDESKKEEMSEWKKSRPKRGQYRKLTSRKLALTIKSQQVAWIRTYK
ncbi:helix-turn-helix protein [Teladorsagia circumcincta]|uniref:Helix-turn-helix protein n=1 Tax=Teladorsagia circumcincta TaxID=45464 RepID=A0A2G9V4M7_TELCI|nr:helix-turn-helix protein [Teladorsagia circumcincta]